MKIQWNKVTWYSQLIAIVLFVGIFALGFYFGARMQTVKMAAQPVGVRHTSNPPLIETFKCASGGKEIQASFSGANAKIDSSDGSSLSCTQIAAPVNQ